MRFRYINIDMNFFKIFRFKKSLCDSRKKKINFFFRRIQNSIYQKNECFDSNLMSFLDFITFDEYKYEILFTCRNIERIYLLRIKMNFLRLLKSILCS